MVQSWAHVQTGFFRLHLTDCRQFTNPALAGFATACPSLTSLDLSGCQQVLDEGLVPLLTACLSLQRVCIRRCFRLTNASLFALARRPDGTRWGDGLEDGSGAGRCLSDLDCSHLPLITDEGLRTVIENQPSLTALRAENCRQVAGEAFCFEHLLHSGLALRRILTLINVSKCPILSTGVAYWYVGPGPIYPPYFTSRSIQSSSLNPHI